MKKRTVLWTMLILAILVGGTAFYVAPRLIQAAPFSNAGSEPRSLSDLVNFTQRSDLTETQLQPLSSTWETALQSMSQYEGTSPIYNDACSKYQCPTGFPLNTVQQGVSLHLPKSNSPAGFSELGYSIAAVGGNVVVGAPFESVNGQGFAGRAYVFDGNTGALVMILQAPSPTSNDLFGYSVAAVGANILIGSPATPGPSRVYLFDGNTGALLIAIQDPAAATGQVSFGSSVAAAGSNILVGSPGATVNGALNAGRAYEFQSNGQLLLTLQESSPGPGAYHNFGNSIAGVGANILVGAYAAAVPPQNVTGGRAFLFDGVTGTQLSSMSDPNLVANEGFGYSVANSNGNLLVGAPFEPTGGRVYLFSSVGLFLTSFQEPTPTPKGQFGSSVAGLGSLILVGARNDTVNGVLGAGRTYLFNGSSFNVIGSLQEPIPAAGDFFGHAVSGSGGTIFVGAPTAAANGVNRAGVAYVFHGAVYSILQTLQERVPGANDLFGRSVTAYGPLLVVGVPGTGGSQPNTGAVYLFDPSTGSLLHIFQEPFHAANDQFGFSVATVGSSILIGSPGTTVAGHPGAGAAYLFSGSTYSLIASFQQPSPADNTNFGWSVAGAGSNILVGAPGVTVNGFANAGTAYLFSGSTYGPLASFPDPVLGGFAGADQYGWSVASAGGNLLIGSPNHVTNIILGQPILEGIVDLYSGTTGYSLLTRFFEPNESPSNGFGTSIAGIGVNILVGSPHTSVNGYTSAGAAYLFSGTTYGLLASFQEPFPATNDLFGNTVSSSGGNALIGSPSLLRAGRAYLFSSSTNNLLASFQGTTQNVEDLFGEWVAGIGGSVFVGAPLANVNGFSNAGLVYVFTGSVFNALSPLEERAPTIREYLGSSVAVSGNTVIVGAPGDSTQTSGAGAVYVYDGVTGALLRVLVSPFPMISGQFGASVASMAGGILVGAPGESVDGVSGNEGRVYLFDATSGALLLTLQEANPMAGDIFGSSSSSLNGNIIVGAPGVPAGTLSNAGRVYVYNGSGSLLLTLQEQVPVGGDYFGFSVASAGNNILVGAPFATTNAQPSAGRAYLFNGATGAQLFSLTETTAAAYSEFGYSVAGVGGNMLIGAPGDNVTQQTLAGRAYLYNGGTGALTTTLQEPTPSASDEFGISVAAFGTNLIVSADGATVKGEPNAGAVYLIDGASFSVLKTFQKTNPSTNDFFGSSLAGSGSIIAIGAYHDSTVALAAGAVYVFFQVPLRNSCLAAALNCKVVRSTGTIQTASGSISVDIVAMSLFSTEYANGTQMALTIICDRDAPDPLFQCSALWIDGDVWSSSREQFNHGFIIVNAQPYTFLRWHWWDPDGQRIVVWSHWWNGPIQDSNWYWTVYWYWRSYVKDNIGIWMPYWWWQWYYTYREYWNFEASPA